jgi:hypothetical protein
MVIGRPCSLTPGGGAGPHRNAAKDLILSMVEMVIEDGAAQRDRKWHELTAATAGHALDGNRHYTPEG